MTDSKKSIKMRKVKAMPTAPIVRACKNPLYTQLNAQRKRKLT